MELETKMEGGKEWKTASAALAVAEPDGLRLSSAYRLSLRSPRPVDSRCDDGGFVVAAPRVDSNSHSRPGRTRKWAIPYGSAVEKAGASSLKAPRTEFGLENSISSQRFVVPVRGPLRPPAAGRTC